VSALGDALASGFNVFAGHTLVGAAPAAVEATVLGWLRDLVGFPQSASGILLSGGSAAGIVALHTARVVALGRAGHDTALTVYATSDAHSSIAKGLRLLGFADEQRRMVTVDLGRCMQPDALRALIDADLAAGRRPLAVVATAGTTSTGAVDPLPALRDIGDRYRLWLHVDGAYGAAAVLVPDARAAVAGLHLWPTHSLSTRTSGGSNRTRSGVCLYAMAGA
jgi:aromatic-L-amino-acid decarboxylase